MQKITCFTAALQMAAAVVYRPDVDLALYRIDPSTYPNVFAYDNFSTTYPPSEWNCAATLVGTRYAISAAHCFNRSHRDFPVEIGGKRHQVINTIRNPCYGKNEEPIEADIAIIELDSDSIVEPATVFQSGPGQGDEIGQEMHVLGWGGSGPIGTVNGKNAE